jgi:hypothetical protein
MDDRYKLFSCLGGLPSNSNKEQCLYLKVHTSKFLSSALNTEMEYIIKIEYGLLESVNILWKTLEQIYDSSNDKRSSSINISKNISLSSIHID